MNKIVHHAPIHYPPHPPNPRKTRTHLFKLPKATIHKHQQIDLTKMNYKIIQDEGAFDNFIEWLPELETNETYLVSLLARKKYANNDPLKGSVISNQIMLKRFTTSKDHLKQKVRQLECPIGAYTINTTDGEAPAPQEMLALYIMPNPRNLLKATRRVLHVLIDTLAVPHNKVEVKPEKDILSAIQTSPSTKHFSLFDFDGVTLEDTITKLNGIVNRDCVSVVRTRGGFHLLIQPNKVEAKYQNTWHTKVSGLEGLDVSGDLLMPVPGCTQGNFVPVFMPLV